MKPTDQMKIPVTNIPVLRIAKGNNKLGKIPNVSTKPGGDCGNSDHCLGDCYAVKAWKQYPKVREAWQANSTLFRKHRAEAFEQLGDWFASKRKAPEFFRIHVSGDFLDQDHVARWCEFARQHPKTKFLAFTKMHGGAPESEARLDYSGRPENMSIVLSMWSGMPDFESDMRRAWVDDGEETRIPDDAIHCPGICDQCGMCWSLDSIGRDVYFSIH